MLNRTPSVRVRLCAAIGALSLAAPLVARNGYERLIGHRATPRPQRGIVGPLRVSAINSRYFEDPAGHVVLLAGSHTWEDVQDGGTHDPPPRFEYERFLNSLQSEGQNFVRLWRWEQVSGNAGTRQPFWISPSIYERTGPRAALDGKPRFDLTRFNEPYFRRLRARLVLAQQKGIYASVMLFDGWSVEPKHAGLGNPWPGHPFNAANNVNGIDGDANGDGAGSETHTLLSPAITALQEAYVRKVVDEVGDLDNVLFEISNESPGASTAWQYHMIRYVKAYERTKRKQHPVGMTAQYPGGTNAALFASPADWISLNGTGDAMSDPAAADGRKIIVDDTDHLCGICGSTEWAWMSFLRGRNPLFMDPYEGEDGLASSVDAHRHAFQSLRRNLGYIRSYADRTNLGDLQPHPELASTRFCLANPDSAHGEYLAYIPGGLRPPARGLRITLDLRATPRRLAVEWFSPRFERVVLRDSIDGGGRRELRAPFVTGDAVLFLHR
jgi:hypothetical protein